MDPKTHWTHPSRVIPIIAIGVIFGIWSFLKAGGSI